MTHTQNRENQSPYTVLEFLTLITQNCTQEKSRGCEKFPKSVSLKSSVSLLYYSARFIISTKKTTNISYIYTKANNKFLHYSYHSHSSDNPDPQHVSEADL